MKKREPIDHIMTKSVITAKKNDGLRKIVDLIKHHSVSHIPIVKDKEVIGIISRTDINRLTFCELFEGQEEADEAILDMLTIPQVMTSKPKTVSSTISIRDLAQIFVAEEFHALPVVDNGQLTGIVTTTDVIRYLLEQYD